MNHVNQKRILLADNDAEYRQTLKSLLELEGYQVDEASSPGEAKAKLENSLFDLALVDLRLIVHDRDSDVSGIEVARFAAEKSIPCIIVTAYNSDETARFALRSHHGERWAEDYIPKKFGPQAVLDAIANTLQRHKADNTIENKLRVDLEKKIVYLDRIELRVSQQQYDLLAFLYQNAGAVCSPEELIKAVYSEQLTHNEAIIDKRLERLVARIREKIEDDPASPRYLVNVQGRGYLLNIDG